MNEIRRKWHNLNEDRKRSAAEHSGAEALCPLAGSSNQRLRFFFFSEANSNVRPQAGLGMDEEMHATSTCMAGLFADKSDAENADTKSVLRSLGTLSGLRQHRKVAHHGSFTLDAVVRDVVTQCVRSISDLHSSTSSHAPNSKPPHSLCGSSACVSSLHSSLGLRLQSNVTSVVHGSKSYFPNKDFRSDVVHASGLAFYDPLDLSLLPVVVSFVFLVLQNLMLPISSMDCVPSILLCCGSNVTIICK